MKAFWFANYLAPLALKVKMTLRGAIAKLLTQSSAARLIDMDFYRYVYLSARTLTGAAKPT